MNLRYVLFLACTAATGGLLFGFDVAIISGAGPFLARHFELGDFGLGVAFSSLLFGCALGAAIAGRLSDRYGRRYVLLWIAVLFALTSVATAIAWDFPSFLAARFIGGLAVGAVSLVSPMYISEVAPAAVRGRLGALYQMSIVTGILVSYCINYLLHDIGPDNWRWMFGTGVIPSVIFFGLLLRAPETPRFLFMAGRRDEARAVMERIGDSQDEVSSAGCRGIDHDPPLMAGNIPAGRAPRRVRRILARHPDPFLRHQYGHRLCADDLPVGGMAAGCRAPVDVRRGHRQFRVHAGVLLDHRSLWPPPLVHRRIAGHGRDARGADHRRAARAFRGPAGPGPDPGLSRLLRFVHRPGVLDAGAGDPAHAYARHGDDRARADTVGGERRGGPVVPGGIESAGASADVRDPGGVFAGAGAVHLEVRAGDQEPDARGDREVLVGDAGAGAGAASETRT